MPQVKVYAARDTVLTYRVTLSEAIHTALVDALSVPAGKPFQQFIALEPENFIHPPDRSPDYLLIEINLFTGRSKEAKKRLIRGLYAQIMGRTPIAAKDIEIIIVESPPENWGIKGLPGDEVKLSYPVDV